MKLIKNFEKPILKKTKTTEEAKEQSLQADILTQEPTIEEKQLLDVEKLEPDYIPFHPVLQSVDKSGWQVSDIWKDIRLDDFCN